MNYLSIRAINLFCAIVSGVVLSYAYYLQVSGLVPCPLCIVQRSIVIVLAVIFCLTAIHNPGKWAARIYGVINFLFATLGMLVSGRQLWLQYLPQSRPEACLPGLHYLIMNFPVTEVIHLLYRGSDDCARVDWSLLGLSLAGWAFMLFALFAILMLIQIFRRETT